MELEGNEDVNGSKNISNVAYKQVDFHGNELDDPLEEDSGSSHERQRDERGLGQGKTNKLKSPPSLIQRAVVLGSGTRNLESEPSEQVVPSAADQSLFSKIKRMSLDFRDIDRNVKRPLEFRLFYWMDLVELLLLTVMFWSAAVKVDHRKDIALQRAGWAGSRLLM